MGKEGNLPKKNFQLKKLLKFILKFMIVMTNIIINKDKII